MMLNKTLDSKHKQLLDQQGTPNGTPESSDDEDEEDPLGCWSNVKIKTNIKILKAKQVTNSDDKAPQTNEKNKKTLKTPKEDEVAGIWSIDSQSGIKRTEFIKPAAIMSTQYPTPQAAEVYPYRLRLQYQAIPTNTPPSSTETLCGDTLNPPTILCCDVQDINQSKSNMPLPAASASPKQTAVLMGENGQAEEQHCWWNWGSPLSSPKSATIVSKKHKPNYSEGKMKHVAQQRGKETDLEELAKRSAELKIKAWEVHRTQAQVNLLAKKEAILGKAATSARTRADFYAKLRVE